MNETQILCFLTTAESKSLTKASEKLFRSVQSLSKHIANLEKELNCELFERNFNGVKLTYAGVEYYNYFCTSRQQLNHTLNTIQYLYDIMKLNFHIGISTWLDPYGKIYQSVSDFVQNHPATNFDILCLSNQDLFAAVKDGSLDIVIVCNSQISVQPDNNVETFAREDLRLFISKHLRNSPESDYILYDASYGSWSQQQWNSTSQRLSQQYIDLKPRSFFHMPNLQSALINVENGCGMAVCDANFGYLTGENSELDNIPINMKSSLACVWNKCNENPLISEFLDFLKSSYNFGSKS